MKQKSLNLQQLCQRLLNFIWPTLQCDSNTRPTKSPSFARLFRGTLIHKPKSFRRRFELERLCCVRPQCKGSCPLESGSDKRIGFLPDSVCILASLSDCFTALIFVNSSASTLLYFPPCLSLPFLQLFLLSYKVKIVYFAIKSDPKV